MFSASKGEYLASCPTSIFKFRMQTVFQINILPFSIAFIRMYTEMY